jgi:hypothetical protein
MINEVSFLEEPGTPTIFSEALPITFIMASVTADNVPGHGPPPESLFKMSVCNMTLICPNLNCHNGKTKRISQQLLFKQKNETFLCLNILNLLNK